MIGGDKDFELEFLLSEELTTVQLFQLVMRLERGLAREGFGNVEGAMTAGYLRRALEQRLEAIEREAAFQLLAAS